jgi:hypothetical protein
MFGQATLEIPRAGDTGPSRTIGLSDDLAMIMGRIAAWTLSEQDGCVAVTLESGEVKLIGHDTSTNALVFGRLA